MKNLSKVNRGRFCVHGNRGVTIVELMVSTLIIGFVIASLTELLVVNLAWANLLESRADSTISTKFFLDQLDLDLSNSRFVTVSNSSGFPIIQTITIDRLGLQVGALHGFDDNGFPQMEETVIYTVEVDPLNPSGYIVRKTIPSISSIIVLRGLVGPFRSGSVAVFSQSGNSVIVNLEVRKTDFGSDVGIFGGNTGLMSNRSSIAIRREYLLRNAKLHSG